MEYFYCAIQPPVQATKILCLIPLPSLSSATAVISGKKKSHQFNICLCLRISTPLLNELLSRWLLVQVRKYFFQRQRNLRVGVGSNLEKPAKSYQGNAFQVNLAFILFYKHLVELQHPHSTHKKNKCELQQNSNFRLAI